MLLTYLIARCYYLFMKLYEYIKSERGNAVRLAQSIGAHVPDVRRWALDPSDKNYRRIPFEYGPKIEKATNGMVSRVDNFDNWKDLWPELVKKKAA